MERKEAEGRERNCSICCSHFIMQSKKLPYFRASRNGSGRKQYSFFISYRRRLVSDFMYYLINP